MLAERHFQVSCQRHLLFCCLFLQLLELSFGGNTHPHFQPCALHGADPLGWFWPRIMGNTILLATGFGPGVGRGLKPRPNQRRPGVCLDSSKDGVSLPHWTWPREVLRARLQLGRAFVTEDKAVTWTRAELSREMGRNWALWFHLSCCIQLCLKPNFFTNCSCSELINSIFAC